MSDKIEIEVDAWQQGWDVVEAKGDDYEAAADAVSGAMSSFVSSHDLEDEEARSELSVFLVNMVAHELTIPQPSDADNDPLDTPEKEEAWGKRKHSLAEALAEALIQWTIHDRHGDKCPDCGEPYQAEAEPAKPGTSKAN